MMWVTPRSSRVVPHRAVMRSERYRLGRICDAVCWNLFPPNVSIVGRPPGILAVNIGPWPVVKSNISDGWLMQRPMATSVWRHLLTRFEPVHRKLIQQCRKETRLVISPSGGIWSPRRRSDSAPCPTSPGKALLSATTGAWRASEFERQDRWGV
jgi:hypothetical protein